MRWSHTRVSTIWSRATILPLSSTTGLFSSLPTVRMAACGGLMIAVNCSMPNMPRFDTVNVPPDSSGGVTVLSLTLPITSRASRAIWPSDFWSASKTVGTTSASIAATAIPTFTRS
jgi:hypothetical protein